jgi:ABC-2 type transport system ATP-binding protein
MEHRMISVEGLTKRFGDVTAVDEISFSIERGKVTGFLGPNGSGKTTTIRMIIGLARPSAGSATIAGSRFIDLEDPAGTVGVLLDGAGAHPKRTGRAHLRALAAERRVQLSRVDISGLAIEDVGMVAALEGVVIYELSRAAHTLEEVFLNLTTMEGAAR